MTGGALVRDFIGFGQYLSVALLFTAIGSNVKELEFGRVFAATTEQTATKTATDDSTSTGTKTGKETGKETDTKTGKETGTKTGKETGTKTGKATKTKDDDKKTTSTSIDPRSPPGGVKMLTPSTGASSYYKIGEHVTFVWNYTSLLVTPSAVNVVASCSLNSATYTISSNMSVEETGKVVWDTKKYQANATVPLLTATYTLVIYDVDSEIGDTAGPGELSSQNQLNFGMYVPQSYTPLNGKFTPPIRILDFKAQASNLIQNTTVLPAAGPYPTWNARPSSLPSA